MEVCRGTAHSMFTRLGRRFLLAVSGSIRAGIHSHKYTQLGPYILCVADTHAHQAGGYIASAPRGNRPQRSAEDQTGPSPATARGPGASGTVAVIATRYRIREPGRAPQRHDREAKAHPEAGKAFAGRN